MHIFCRETRAHLEMHPHLVNEETEAGLITPDLWLKNCKSPEPRPYSPPVSPKLVDVLPQTSPLPLITVAHPSKLLQSPEKQELKKRIRNGKVTKSRKRCPSASTSSSSLKVQEEGPQDLRIRHSPEVSSESDHFKELTKRIHLSHVHEAQTNFRDKISNQYNLNTSFHHKNFKLHEETGNGSVPSINKQTQHGNVFPPVTVLVPFPILLPVPFPIPIPLPISSFLAATEIPNRDKINTINNDSQNELLDCSSKKCDSSQETQDAEKENDKDDKEDDVKSTSVNGLMRNGTRKRKRISEPRKVDVKIKKPLSV